MTKAKKARTIHVVEITFAGGWHPFSCGTLAHCMVEMQGLIDRGQRSSCSVRITKFVEAVPPSKIKARTTYPNGMTKARYEAEVRFAASSNKRKSKP